MFLVVMYNSKIYSWRKKNQAGSKHQCTVTAKSD